jgi:hypothetical protein
MRREKYWHCGLDDTVRWGSELNSVVVLHLQRRFRLNVVQYIPLKRSFFLSDQRSDILVCSAFQTGDLHPRRSKLPSRMAYRSKRRNREDSVELWHRRAGHLGPEALLRAVECARGVRIKGPATFECQACALGKVKKQISLESSENRSRQPFWRIHLDYFKLPTAYNSHQYAFIVKDEYNGMLFCRTMISRPEAFDILIDFESKIKRVCGLSVCKIRMDNDTALISLPQHKNPSPFERWVMDEGIDLELPPSHTKEPNGAAERAGGAVQEKARTMGIESSLPNNLWPEIWQAATYLIGVSP